MDQKSTNPVPIQRSRADSNASSNSPRNSPRSWTDSRPKYVHKRKLRGSELETPKQREIVQQPTTMFGELPTEIVIHILSHCDSNTLTNSIPLTCKRLYEISKDDASWKMAFQRYFNALPTRKIGIWMGEWSWQREYIARIKHQASWTSGTFNIALGEQTVKQSRVGGVQFECRFGSGQGVVGSVDRLAMSAIGNVLLAGCLDRGLVCIADPVSGKMSSRDVMLSNGNGSTTETRQHLTASEDGTPLITSCLAVDSTGVVAMGSPQGGVMICFGHILQANPNHPVGQVTLAPVPLTHARFPGSISHGMLEIFQLSHPPHAPMATTALVWQVRDKKSLTAHPTWLMSAGGVNDGMAYLYNTSKLPNCHAVACLTTHSQKDLDGESVPGVATLHVDEARGLVIGVLMESKGIAVWNLNFKVLSNPPEPLTAKEPTKILSLKDLFETNVEGEVFSLVHGNLMVVSASHEVLGDVKKQVASVVALNLDTLQLVWRGYNGHTSPYFMERDSSPITLSLNTKITSMAWDKVPGKALGRGKSINSASGGPTILSDQVSLCGYGMEIEDKTTLVTGDELGRVVVWNLKSSQPLITYTLPPLKRALQEYHVMLKDVEGSIIPPMEFSHPITHLHVDAGKVVTCQPDSIVRVRDVLTGQLLRELTVGTNRRWTWQDDHDHHTTPTSLLVTGSRIIVGTRGGSVKTWIAWGLERIGSWNTLPKKHSQPKKTLVSTSPGTGPRGEAMQSLRDHLEDHYDAMREGQRKTQRMTKINGGFTLEGGWNDDDLVKYVSMVSLEEAQEREAILQVVRDADRVVMPRHMAVHNRQTSPFVESEEEEDVEPLPRPPREEFDPFNGPEQLGSSYRSSYGSQPTPIPTLQRRTMERAESASSLSDGTPRSRRASKSALDWTTLRFGSGSGTNQASPRLGGIWSGVSLPRGMGSEKVTSIRRDYNSEDDEDLQYVLELSKVEM